MVGKWQGSGCASIAPSFVEQSHGKHYHHRFPVLIILEESRTQNTSNIVLGGPSSPQTNVSLAWITVLPTRNNKKYNFKETMGCLIDLFCWR